MNDLEVTCVEANCRQKFVITVQEQQWYTEKQYTLPKRCKPCRQARKAQNNQRVNAPSTQESPGSPLYTAPPEDRGFGDRRGGMKKKRGGGNDRRGGGRRRDYEGY